MTDEEKLTALRVENRKLRRCRDDLLTALEGALADADAGTGPREEHRTTLEFWRKPILRRVFPPPEAA